MKIKPVVQSILKPIVIIEEDIKELEFLEETTEPQPEESEPQTTEEKQK